MRKIHSFFLRLLFLITPIIYAWFYIPGIPGNLSLFTSSLGFSLAGFEGVKVEWFLFCIIGASIFFLAELFFRETVSFKKFLPVLFFFLACIGVSYWINYDNNPFFFSGTLEKHHGLLFFSGLILLYFFLRGATLSEKKQYLLMTSIGFGIVILYAIFQWI